MTDDDDREDIDWDLYALLEDDSAFWIDAVDDDGS
jgi:hypothetical protein